VSVDQLLIVEGFGINIPGNEITDSLHVRVNRLGIRARGL
jgi:hypothetical protein